MAQTQEEPSPPTIRPSSYIGSQKRIRELDGWRAISVLLVILHHLFSIQFSGLVRPVYLLWHILGLAGFLGVDTFFVISGFVICRLLVSEESRYGFLSLKGFYYRRIFRILPPLYLYVVAIALLIATGLIQERWVSLAIAAAFLADVNVLPGSWFFGHTWSLAVEEQFYLIFPTLWILSRRRWRAFVFACVFLLCLVWNLSLAVSHQVNPAVDARTRVGFACICFGVLMAVHERPVRHFAARVPGWIVSLVALTLLIHPVPHGAFNESLFSALLMPPAIGLILMHSLECGGWLRSFLCSRPIQAVGITSYGIYLWQQLFTAPVSLYSWEAPGAPFFLSLLCVVVPLSYFFVEKPAIHFGKMLSKGAREKADLRSK
ncbi:acyltransferase family protein [Acidicapsa acidisoli]|uniref:acyltransferase family protein n=1 Tax=Acidicapsa acidisoli TaxID=1615681 RepID=UPI0021DFBE9A|nr:acyltransferase [Acidicapsa acidisoli]